MFSNDIVIVSIFKSVIFQTNLVAPSKNVPFHSILFHINEFTPLATYNLPLCVKIGIQPMSPITVALGVYLLTPR
jgi:hypothetical protein